MKSKDIECEIKPYILVQKVKVAYNKKKRDRARYGECTGDLLFMHYLDHYTVQSVLR